MLEMIELDNLLNGLFPVCRAKHREIFDMRCLLEHLHTTTEKHGARGSLIWDEQENQSLLADLHAPYQSRITSGSSRLVTLILV
jgi:hypothetical protein